MTRRRAETAGRAISVVLDADAISKVARRDPVVRAMLRREIDEIGSRLVIPLVAVMQALRGTREHAIIERLVRGAHEQPGLDYATAAAAAALLRAAEMTDVPDALVATEALRRAPAIVITSDPSDIRRLLDGDPNGPRVNVWRV